MNETLTKELLRSIAQQKEIRKWYKEEIYDKMEDQIMNKTTIINDELSDKFDLIIKKIIIYKNDIDFKDKIFDDINDLKEKVLREMIENRKLFDEKIKILTETIEYLDSYINKRSSIEVLKEINEYLNSNRYNSIECGSITHKKIEKILKEIK